MTTPPERTPPLSNQPCSREKETAISRHQQRSQYSVGALRSAWDDTGWRTVIIASPLGFLLGALMAVTGNPGGTGLRWTAMLTTLFVISRALTRRPLRGQRSDVATLTLLLAIAGTIAIQVVYAFTTVGATFVAGQQRGGRDRDRPSSLRWSGARRGSRDGQSTTTPRPVWVDAKLPRALSICHHCRRRSGLAAKEGTQWRSAKRGPPGARNAPAQRRRRPEASAERTSGRWRAGPA